MNPSEKRIIQLMDEHGDYLKRTAFLFLRDAGLAEDMTQETFISFYRSGYQYHGHASHRTYLYRILMNHCKMYLRKHKNHTGSPVPELHETFEGELVRQMDITRAMDTLDEKGREVLVLHYYNEFSVQEISEILNVGVSGVKMRLLRAREQMRNRLGEEAAYEF